MRAVHTTARPRVTTEKPVIAGFAATLSGVDVAGDPIALWEVADLERTPEAVHLEVAVRGARHFPAAEEVGVGLPRRREVAGQPGGLVDVRLGQDHEHRGADRLGVHPDAPDDQGEGVDHPVRRLDRVVVGPEEDGRL